MERLVWFVQGPVSLRLMLLAGLGLMGSRLNSDNGKRLRSFID